MPYYYFGYDLIGWILVGVGAIITIVADVYVNNSYRKYKRVKLQTDITGCEVARKILDANGLKDVYVVETKGVLSDHYDPTRKTIRLSKDIFHGNSIASASVAAHEVGHALQDKTGYKFMRIRSFLIPFTNFGSKFGYIALLIGLIFGLTDIAWAGIGLLLLIVLFQLVTLPVEFNASFRAGLQLDKLGILNLDEQKESKKMLRSAAYTYVASLATTLLEILRLLLIVIARGRDD